MYRFIAISRPPKRHSGHARASLRSRVLAQTAGLAIVGGLFTPAFAPVALAHHQPGHHGSPVAECDCPKGIELREEARVRMLPPGQTTTAAFFTLVNQTDQPLEIRSAESPAAMRVELHTHATDAGGVMRMRPVEEIVVPADGEVTLAPGGLHLMLIGLQEPLTEGQVIPITLFVEGHADLSIDAVVQADMQPKHSSMDTPTHEHAPTR